MNLVTLTQAKRYLGIPAQMTDDDALIQRLLLDAEQWAENTAHRSFKPVIETRTFDWLGSYELYFNDDLCELITATNGDSGSTVIPLTEFAYEPRRAYPKYGVIIKRGSDYIWEYDETSEDAISLKAAWCCHDDWGRAWVDSGDKVLDAAGINASVTLITVANVEGANTELDEPRFSVGMLLKAELEWMEVTAVPTRTTLTVTRGARGSTAATHALNTVLYTFKPHRSVVEAILLYCHWRYNQKNLRGTAGFNAEIPADITALLPSPVGAYLGS